MGSGITTVRFGRRQIFALSLASCLLAAGCTSAGESTVPDGQTTQPTTTSGGADTTQPTVVAGDVELGPGTFDLGDPRTGLAELTSYRQTLNVSFSGTKDGQPHQWSKTYLLFHSNELSASVLTLESSGEVELPDPGVLAEADGAIYEAHRDGSCTGMPIGPESSTIALLEPAGFIPGLLGAEETGSEPANGIEAMHYRFDERALVESGRSESDGELWVALEGGFVVSYRLTATADAAYFDEGVAGTITWEYDLTEIDQLSEIAVPAGCQIDVPSMPDATNLFVLPRYLGFDTPSALTDVVAFYRDQLSQRSWTPSGDPVVAGDVAIDVYAKGSESLTVMVTTGDTGTRVDVSLSAE